MKLAPLLLSSVLAAETAGVRLPPYTRQELPNGVVLCLLPKRDAPLLTLRAVVRGGAESDPAHLAGLSALVVDLLRRGAGARGADQFALDLEQFGGTFGTYVTPQATIISAESLPEFSERLVELLADAILRPRFAETEIREAVAQAVAAARALKESPDAASWQYFRSFHFGASHAYGRPVRGDEGTLGRITGKHISAHHQRMYVGANLILIAAGSFDAARMRALLARAFEGMPRGSRYRWPPDRPAGQAGGRRLLLVNAPAATQTNFLIGFRGIHRAHRDRVAVWLANSAFGGRFSSLLNEELRVQSGLTYGAYSYFNQNRLTGAIVISSYTATDTTADALALALNVLEEFGARGVSPEQLATTKTYLKGAYPPDNLQTARQLASVLGDLEIFGLGRDEIDTLYSRIDAATLDQVNSAVKKYFRPKSMDLVLVGNASRIRAAAAALAPQILEVPIAAPGFSAPESRSPAREERDGGSMRSRWQTRRNLAPATPACPR